MAAHAVSLGERLPRPRRTRQFLHRFADGLETTVYVASWPRRATRVRVAALDPPQPLRAWARRAGVADALVGGFHVAPPTAPLGELWTDGAQHLSVPFDEPWDACRACIAIDRGEIDIAPRGALPARPRGDLLQAGPLLVMNGTPLVRPRDPEGLHASWLHKADNVRRTWAHFEAKDLQVTTLPDANRALEIADGHARERAAGGLRPRRAREPLPVPRLPLVALEPALEVVEGGRMPGAADLLDRLLSAEGRRDTQQEQHGRSQE